MPDDMHFWSAPVHRLRRALTDSRTLAVHIRRTDRGVRIKFSDGRITWMDKDDRLTESGFVRSVTEWARRMGADSIELEYE